MHTPNIHVANLNFVTKGLSFTLSKLISYLGDTLFTFWLPKLKGKITVNIAIVLAEFKSAHLHSKGYIIYKITTADNCAIVLFMFGQIVLEFSLSFTERLSLRKHQH